MIITLQNIERGETQFLAVTIDHWSISQPLPPPRPYSPLPDNFCTVPDYDCDCGCRFGYCYAAMAMIVTVTVAAVMAMAWLLLF